MAQTEKIMKTYEIKRTVIERFQIVASSKQEAIDFLLDGWQPYQREVRSEKVTLNKKLCPTTPQP